MKQILLFLGVSVLGVLLFTTPLAGAACSPDPNDMGVCDTIYVETFDCDHWYDTTGTYDSVRVAIYVTHDSNTFFWAEFPPSGKWVQDSISTFNVPLNFWQVGCADSVIFPTNANWNNKKTDRGNALFKRSIYRDLINKHVSPPETTFNRFADMADLGADDWGCTIDIDRKASGSSDSGHVFFAIIPNPSGASQRWQDGSRVLLVTMTFLVYKPKSCDTTQIYFDSTSWGPEYVNKLRFTRYDAVDYYPRHFLPTADTIYTDVRWIQGATEEENRPTSFLLSQNYPNPFNPVTSFKFTLPQACHVKVEIFNILGQKVKTLADEEMKAGVFIADWDGKDDRGIEVSSGIYFYRLTADDFSNIKRMVLLK